MRNRNHRDTSLPAETRADLLLAEMTIREKANQLVAVPPWWLVTPDGTEPSERSETLAQAPGHISNFGVDDPRAFADVVARLQRVNLEGTRLGVPLLVHTEALNGFLAGGHMVFPTPTGLAATWSPELIEEMAALIRTQMKRVGVRQALSPNMDIALDPRWGRMHETYGEDPYLAAAFSVAFTRGMQTDDLREGVIATAKHFVGYSLPEGGVNLSAYEGGPRRTRDLFAYPVEASIQMAGLASVMNAYSDYDGVPAAASRPLLTELLRETLGFDGFVSSDYMTLEHIVTRQFAARTPGAAAALTLAAGLDTEFPVPYGYGDILAQEVQAGRMPASQLDAAARRVLEAKFRLGLFEDCFPAEHIDVHAIAAEGTDLSRELARRSVVLLTNDGILPLPQEGTRIGVVGPHADAVTYQFATYSYPAFREMTQYMTSGGMGNMVGVDVGMASWNEAVFSPASVKEYVSDRLGATSLVEALGTHADEVSWAPGCTLTTDLGDEAIADAVAVAKNSDVVVLALGGASLWFNGERTEGEGSDSANIALPAAQVRLAEAIASTGTPMLAVLVQGRPYTLPTVVEAASAILVSSFNGPFGSRAIADVLFGASEPEGKLPYSIPRHGGQIPVYHHQRSGTGSRNPLPPDVSDLYLDMPATPRFPFAHGLSYSDFTVTDLVVDGTFTTAGSVTVAATISNAGDRAGVAVPQLYYRAEAVGVTRPAQQLGGFTRVEIAPGGRVRVEFTLDAAQLGCTGLEGQFSVEPGRLDVWVGFDADDSENRVELELAGDRRMLKSAGRVFLSSVRVIPAE